MTMKKIVIKYKWTYLMVLCCTLFVACEPKIVTTPERGNPIGFGETGRYNGSHKNTIPDADVNGTLWCYYGTYMVYNGVDIQLKDFNYDIENSDYASADIDIEDEQKYWTDNTYNFFSITPRVSATLNTTSNSLECTFDISATDNHQDTLRIAKTLGIDGGEYNENNTAVQMRYENMLARVKFVGYSDLTNIPVTLNSIALTTPKTATYTASTGGYTQSNLSTTEKTTITESGQYTLYWNGYTGQTGYAGTLIRDEGFLVHPGAVTNSTFVVKYQDAAGTEVTTEPIAFPTESGVTEWQRGQSYIYTLKIKTAGEITFGTVTIKPWEDGASVNITQWDDIK
jgi:hypothetical protein